MLREDLKNDPYLLRDIGIGVVDAQAEAARFFWQPVLLKTADRELDARQQSRCD